MELIYRGIRYKSNNLKSPTIQGKKLSIKKKLAKAKNGCSFPAIAYYKQLLFNRNLSVRDPKLFWHLYRSQFLDKCWKLNMSEQLDFCWELTLKIELARALKDRTPVKLKYRGITYYR